MPVKPLNESVRYRKATREMAGWLAGTAVSGAIALGSVFGMAVGASGSIENLLGSMPKPANTVTQMSAPSRDTGEGMALVAIFGTTLVLSAAGTLVTGVKASEASDRRTLIKRSLGYYD